MTDCIIASGIPPVNGNFVTLATRITLSAVWVEHGKPPDFWEKRVAVTCQEQFQMIAFPAASTDRGAQQLAHSYVSANLHFTRRFYLSAWEGTLGSSEAGKDSNIFSAP